MMSHLFQSHLSTPLGDMLAVSSSKGLCLLEFMEGKYMCHSLAKLEQVKKARCIDAPDHPLLLRAQMQLDAYFAGQLRAFSVDLDMVGTPFQIRAWQALLAIEYGQTRSYTQQAQAVGNVKAVRAVAAANGRNKISIIVPCHRVIGSDGRLVGYASGVARKQFLLNLEAQNRGITCASTNMF